MDEGMSTVGGEALERRKGRDRRFTLGGFYVAIGADGTLVDGDGIHDDADADASPETDDAPTSTLLDTHDSVFADSTMHGAGTHL